jgi:hypothetical protein
LIPLIKRVAADFQKAKLRSKSGLKKTMDNLMRLISILKT